MNFIYSLHADDAFIRYMLDRINLDLRRQHLDGPNWFCVSVIEGTTGHVVAGLACEFKTPFDAYFSAAIDEPEVITRVFLRGIFQALFTKAVRITAEVDPNDIHTQNVVLRLGFVYEGFKRRGLNGDRDAMMFGMLREDCRYLPGVRAVRTMGETDGKPAQEPGPLRHRERPTERKHRIVSGQRYH